MTEGFGEEKEGMGRGGGLHGEEVFFIGDGKLSGELLSSAVIGELLTDTKRTDGEVSN